MDDADRPLAAALADLARTMPDEPRRLSKVRERARRARRRRTVAQGTVVTATVGGLALGLVATGPGSGGGAGRAVTGLPAGAPTTPETTAPTNSPVDPAVLPSCADVAALQAAKAAEVAAMGDADAAKQAHADADAAKQAQADADGRVAEEPIGPDPAGVVAAKGEAAKEPFDPSHLADRGPFRGQALVSGPADGPTLTLAVKDVTVTVVVDDSTRFVVDAADVARPPLADGTEVGFQVSRTEAGDLHLDELDVLPEKVPGDLSADASAPSGGGIVQSVSATSPVAGTTAAIAVEDGPFHGQTVTFTVGPDTRWLADKAPCQPTDLAAGTKIGFSATAVGDGTYLLDQVDLPSDG